MTIDSVVGSIIVAIVVSLPGLWGARQQMLKDRDAAKAANRKASADITDANLRAIMSTIEMLNTTIRDMTTRLDAKQNRIDELEAEIDRITSRSPASRTRKSDKE